MQNAFTENEAHLHACLSLSYTSAFAGELVYNTGNICMHMFSVKFLREVAEQHLTSALSYHVAKKKIPTLNEKVSWYNAVVCVWCVVYVVCLLCISSFARWPSTSALS